MTNPQQELQVALDAIQSDAAVWDDSANELAEVSDLVNSQQLDAADFSYIGDQMGLTEMYSALQEKVATLLREGDASLTEMSTALRACAEEYQRADDKGSGLLNEAGKGLPS